MVELEVTAADTDPTVCSAPPGDTTLNTGTDIDNEATKGSSSTPLQSQGSQYDDQSHPHRITTATSK